ncbi:hypothetical protein [Companilactobacillus sp. HBUAS59699]|uniref:hypothetical protein n=1 Tax=Companilactobacillus sp. HBUAS59699 TaxID=3109358 RepID=UPI002FF27B75
MTKLNEIESKLSNILESNKNEIQNYVVKIGTADEAIHDANDELKNAEMNVNVNDYNTAKNNIWSAKHAKELYEKTKNKLENKPLIDREQYKSLLIEIKETADNEQDELNKKAIDLIKNIHTIADESREITSKANELISKLQRNIYREPEGNIDNANGGTTWSSDETYKANVSVGGFYTSRIKGTRLSKLAGEEPQRERNSYWG